jgi:hypothetical protein
VPFDNNDLQLCGQRLGEVSELSYIIEKATTKPTLSPEHYVYYSVKHIKTALDLDGKEVTIIDDQRDERVAVEHLTVKKEELQKKIEEIDDKLAKIKALKI